MSNRSSMIDVFMSYALPDKSFAGNVEKALRSKSISVFRPSEEVSAAAYIVRSLREALGESRVHLVVWTHQAARSPNVAVEIGAGLAWGKPMYFVTRPGDAVPPLPVESASVFSYNEMSTLITAIRENLLPLSDESRSRIREAFLAMGRAVDSLATDVSALSELTRNVNSGQTNQISSEQLLAELLRMRKRGDFSPQKKRPPD